jgi:hypothetical protein
VTIGLILMECKIFSQDDQRGILCAIFDKTTSSLHTSMSIQIVQWSKGLIVDVLQMISTSDQTHLLTYLKIRFSPISNVSIQREIFKTAFVLTRNADA